MLVTPSIRHCSNKYKLAMEGEKDKEKDEDFEKSERRMKSSSVERDEFSVVAWRLTGIQHSGWGWEDHSTSQERCILHSESFVEVWLCLMEVQPEEHCSSPAWKWQGSGQEVVQHALSERTWSFWCCVVQTCKIEQFLQCSLWRSAGHQRLHQDFWPKLMG